MSKSGYQNLIVYQQAVLIYDLNELFCGRFLDRFRDKRTVEQMQQASRSGKQNIVEASLEKSLKMNIKLNGVSRGSFGELLEDYKDFLRTRGLELWDKADKRLEPIRLMRIVPGEPNWPNLSDWSDWTDNAERFTNLMLTLISKENYLLDKLIKVLEDKFVREGGYSENLTKKRLQEKKRQVSSWIANRW